MRVRQDIADFVSALFWVYTLCVLAYIVMSLVFSLGLRMPYSRPLNAVMDFLRDVTEPFLRIFRRLGLQFGPFDLSPIIALFVLQLASRLIVGIIAP
jgi:YggT family protein